MGALDPVVVLYPGDLNEAFAAFALLEAGRCVALLPAGMELDVGAATPGASGASIAVTSSGSTGRPKLVWREWETLKGSASRHPAVAGWRWAAPYDPWSFAGAQVAVQAWVGGGGVLSLSANWQQTWRRLEAERIDALSCTPTFVDLLLQNEPAGGSRWQPRQLTLGGESLRAGTADRIRRRWPDTRGTAVYASAEFGVVMKTSRLDGWYEIGDLEKRWPRWRIVDGTLELGVGPAGWASTGDQAEQRSGLLRIVGRSDQVANVAGTKVSLAHVAALAEEVPGVRRARASAKANSVTGQVVVLHFEVERDAEAEQVRPELERSLRARLPKAAWPRDWVEEEVGLAGNAKRALA